MGGIQFISSSFSYIPSMSIKSLFAITFYLGFFLSHAQEWKPDKESWNQRVERGGELIKGIGFGFSAQGQTNYPKQYFGPTVDGLYNDGAYGLYIDLYIKNLILGLQLTDEYFFITGGRDTAITWKPRGFNKSFSSLTRTFWLSLGYSLFSEAYFKINIGLRRGPFEGIMYSKTPFNEVASGFDFEDTSSLYTNNELLSNSFSEIDFTLGFNYPIHISEKLSFVPELGYSFRYGGIITALSLKRKIKK